MQTQPYLLANIMLTDLWNPEQMAQFQVKFANDVQPQ